MRTATPVLSVKDRVYNTVRERIMTLVFKPGQALSEQELSVLLKVSRTPVREALIRLANEDLVVILPQRGTYVSKIPLSAVRESCFIRGALETAVIHQVVKSADDHALAQLEQLVDRQARFAECNDHPQFYACDELFHRTLCELSLFPSTWDVVHSVKRHMDRARYLSLPIESRVRTIISQHRQIVDAILKRNSPAAENLMRTHIEDTLGYIEQLGGKFPDYFDLDQEA